MAISRFRNQLNKKGSILALLFLLMFGFLAIATLVIDVGLARIAQTQMQSSVDNTVKIGLREGRAAVQNLVSRTFDNNLDPTDGDPLNYGGGPNVVLGAGIGALNGSRLITTNAPGSYKPELELNNGSNEIHGDMVSGNYNRALGEEQADYTRDDFSADADGNDFLLRMRRTNNFSGLDDVDDVSSQGEAIPFLFGMGTLMTGQNPADGYSARFHGLSTRATAIASTRNVVSVGLSDPLLNLPGATPFVLSLEFWNELNAPFTAEISTGAIHPIGVSTNTLGYFLTDELTSVGLELDLINNINPSFDYTSISGNQFGYVGLYQFIPETNQNHIVGFGGITFECVAPCEDPFQILLEKQISEVAVENASAMPSQISAQALNDTTLNEILNIHQAIDEPLVTSVLVR